MSSYFSSNEVDVLRVMGRVEHIDPRCVGRNFAFGFGRRRTSGFDRRKDLESDRIYSDSTVGGMIVSDPKRTELIKHMSRMRLHQTITKSLPAQTHKQSS